ncbi:hypothetical protein MMC11_000240 [Xylographa trunciseda]|nr:hypothetical protein [Xylographa trunciseda]
MESLQRLVVEQSHAANDRASIDETSISAKKDEFQDLSEMLNMGELDTVRRWGGRMHREHQADEDERHSYKAASKSRIVLKDLTPDLSTTHNPNGRGSGILSGVYQHYLLLRPYPSLRVLFASPSLRVPGILQSQFMDKIGGSARVQDELTAALAEGRGVTAKVRWLTKFDDEGRNRWIHCTPLLGSNGRVGVWMVVLVDEEDGLNRRWKQAPPVATNFGNGSRTNLDTQGGMVHDGDYFPHSSSIRSSSPYSL